ncbi:hypothetical protein ABT187_19465 [Streptomyces sp. NPDC001817]|uniref:hypothetical protein n=1 Tax=Streptomyces sp. NPDC001817 TaxID=3154398 RepID=UPI00331A3CD3
MPHVVHAAADYDDGWCGIEWVPEVGGAIAARWARRPLEGPLRPLARFGALFMRPWEVRYGPERVAEGAGAREVRRLLGTGLLTAPTAEAAYALAAPSSAGPRG